jgi:hypothetical protein
MESQAPAKGAAQHELFDMEIPEATIGSTALNCFNRFAQNRIHVHFLDKDEINAPACTAVGPFLALKALPALT